MSPFVVNVSTRYFIQNILKLNLTYSSPLYEPALQGRNDISRVLALWSYIFNLPGGPHSEPEILLKSFTKLSIQSNMSSLIFEDKNDDIILIFPTCSWINPSQKQNLFEHFNIILTFILLSF